MHFFGDRTSTEEPHSTRANHEGHAGQHNEHLTVPGSSNIPLTRTSMFIIRDVDFG